MKDIRHHLHRLEKSDADDACLIHDVNIDDTLAVYKPLDGHNIFDEFGDFVYVVFFMRDGTVELAYAEWTVDTGTRTYDSVEYAGNNLVIEKTVVVWGNPQV